MGHRTNRILAWALVVSFAFHLVLGLSAGGLFTLPAAELDFPIEANLVPAEVETRLDDRRPVSPTRTPPRRPPAPLPVSAAEPPKATPPASSLIPAPVEVAPDVSSAAAPEPAPTPVPAPVVVESPSRSPLPAPPPPPLPPRPAMRTPDDDLVIRYSVQTGEGEGGFVAGRATYIWHRRDGRYSLVSTVEATGLAALFISGRIVQVSEGEVDASGLRPSQYWLQRNERKRDVARFNWELNQLSLAGRPGVHLAPGAQDLLGFPFHLAMTAREGEAPFVLAVTNGRKLNEYTFRVVGREPLDLRGRQLDTLHLQGVREGEGSLDVWLDLGRAGLPARVRTIDHKGKVMELRLEAAGSAADDSGR